MLQAFENRKEKQLAVNTQITERKQNTKLVTVFAVLLIILALVLGMFAMPATKSEAASLKKVTTCKGLEVKLYDSKSNIWWTYKGNTRVSYTGIAWNDYGWWRTVNGKVDFNYTGIAQNDNGWYRILLYGGIVGYVSPKVVSRVSEPGENPDATPAPAAKAEEAETGNTVTIRRQGNVNVRKEPKFDSEKVGTAIAGRRYPLLDTAENGWYRIRLGNGVEGYISNKLAK